MSVEDQSELAINNPRKMIEPNKDYQSAERTSMDMHDSQMQTTQISMLENTEPRQMSMLDKPINISAWEQTNGRSSDLHHDSLIEGSESEQMVASGSPMANSKKGRRRTGEWSRLSNTNKLIKVQDAKRGIGRIEVPKQKFVKSSIAWYSIHDSQKQHSNEPIKQGYRNSIDFRSLEPMESRFESDSQAMVKP